ncbi:hypothetical protein PRZ48_009777 [Zasmidium cellare]|uniref:Aromatic prenyltransferase n=1 Tax=Zasmidium cellare TaxID=395010 RepID=A0ABR0ECN6_ZASCE|nr:hypothetical protein PRZ48_009777 [Zasmidium cellare]
MANSHSSNGDSKVLHTGSSPDQQDADLEYWRLTTGQHLSRMLEFANYPPNVSEQYTNLYTATLCPLMGPQPHAASTKVRSCLTTDGTPVEYSFSFEGETKAPTVRFCVEPDGTSRDLLSTRRARSMVEMLARGPVRGTVEMSEWVHSLLDYFQLPELPNAERKKLLTKVGHRSQVTFGFDLDRNVDSFNAKIYFNPCFKAAITGETRWQVADGAISRLLDESQDADLQASISKQLSLLRSHLLAYPHEVQDSARYLSVDVAKPQASRIKVYVRCPEQTFDGVWQFLTMKDTILYSEDHKAAIKDLYSLVRGETLDSTTANFMQSSLQNVPSKKINICYFVLKHGSSTPTSKLFIRVQQPFVDSDATVARGLETWFQRWHWLDDDSHSWNYSQLLRTMIPHRELEADTGLHSWIAVSVKKGKLTVETYLTPELYKQQE